MKSKTAYCLVIIFTISILVLTMLTGCIVKTQSAKSTLKTFLTYEKYNQWDEAWEMLHPDSQASWVNRETFVEEMNQPSTNLKAFKIGRARLESSWTSRSTGKTYHEVVAFPTTLIYSSAHYGEIERSMIIHAVQLSGSWKFIQQPDR